MRRIGLLTSDFSLYHDLVKSLRERGLAFTSLAFGERPEPNVGVLVTSWKDALSPDLPEDLPVVPVAVDADGREDVEGAIAKALRILEGVEGYTEVVVGIDPGKRPGVALLADGRLLHASQVYRVDDVGTLVRALLSQYPYERGVVRIGHGSPRERDDIVRTLWRLREDGIRIEVVDESGTTPPTGTVDWPPDVAAAILIARTPGAAPTRAPRAVPGTPKEPGRVTKRRRNRSSRAGTSKG